MSLVGNALLGVAMAADAESLDESEALAEDVRRAPGSEPVPRASVGASVGASFSLAGLGASVVPGLEASVVLDPKGRVAVVLGGSYCTGSASGVGDDPSLEDGFSWTVDVSAATISPGVRLRLIPWQERVAPTVALGPLLAVGTAVASGRAGSARFPVTHESWWGVGGWARFGLAVHLGPGSLEPQLGLTLSTMDSDVTGDPLLISLQPAISYRFER